MFEIPEDRAFLIDLKDGVLRLSFNRPEFGNAMSPPTVPKLIKVLEEACANDQVRCLLIRGEGKTFSAGGDVSIFRQSLEQDATARQADFARRIGNLCRLVELLVAFEQPIVVALRGAAAGAGLCYPLAADYVIGDPTAAFVFAHQNIGLSPDGGVTTLLPNVVGPRTARALLMTAAKVKAEEALRLGLINRLVPGEDLEKEAATMAQRLARAPQRAVVLAKRLVNESENRTLSEQLEAELAGIVACVGDTDFDEGVRAFLEKRSPNFPSANKN